MILFIGIQFVDISKLGLNSKFSYSFVDSLRSR